VLTEGWSPSAARYPVACATMAFVGPNLPRKVPGRRYLPKRVSPGVDTDRANALKAAGSRGDIPSTPESSVRGAIAGPIAEPAGSTSRGCTTPRECPVDGPAVAAVRTAMAIDPGAMASSAQSTFVVVRHARDRNLACGADM